MNIIAVCNELYNSTKLFQKKNIYYITDQDELNLELLNKIKPRYIFFPHWSYKIPAEIYENYECVIFHETDLPFGRGGSPLQNLIERSIYHTKITALKCNAKFDAGDIYLKKDFSLKEKPAHQLYKEIGNIVSEMIDEIIVKEIKPVPQAGEITVFKRRVPSQSDISSLTSLERIFDYIRMLDAPGYPKAFLKHNNIQYLFNNVKKVGEKLMATVEIKNTQEREREREKKRESRNTILIIAAHPDDEVLGCFGTVSKMIKNGDEAYTIILSKGKTSRNEGIDEQEKLKLEMEKANASIGIKKVFQLDFPDNAFDSVPLLEIIKSIETIKEKIKPNIIFTHYIHDINIDHQITAQAVLTAARPIKGETVKEIYFMEVPSSTEWNSYTQQTAFVPNVFSDITHTINDKIKAMKIYQSELRDSSHPRSLSHLKLYAKTNGTKVGLEYVENFILVRKEI